MCAKSYSKRTVRVNYPFHYAKLQILYMKFLCRVINNWFGFAFTPTMYEVLHTQCFSNPARVICGFFSQTLGKHWVYSASCITLVEGQNQIPMLLTNNKGIKIWWLTSSRNIDRIPRLHDDRATKIWFLSLVLTVKLKEIVRFAII